jgi:hypothetical protein
MRTFAAYLKARLAEGLMVADSKAEDGKSRVRQPPNKMQLPPCGAAG